jgi:circadian clock protein KaiC
MFIAIVLYFFKPLRYTGYMLSFIPCFLNRAIYKYNQVIKYLQNNRRDIMPEDEIERVKTYVERLDKYLEGGVPKGTVSLICGTAGCMKSSLVYSILYNNAKENRKGLYITFEQDIKSLLQHMKKLNITFEQDIKSLLQHMKGLNMGESENLLLADYDMVARRIREEVKEKIKFGQNWIKLLEGYVEETKEKEGYELLVIDSLDALYAITTIKNPRSEVHHFFRVLREIGVTSFLVSEMQKATSTYSRYGIEEFLSDAIIHLDYQKMGPAATSIERFISIVKMRSTNHSRECFPLLHSGDSHSGNKLQLINHEISQD